MNQDISNKYNYQLSNLESRITLPRGEDLVGLIIKNAKIIYVFLGEIHENDIAIADGIVIGFGNGYDTKHSFDAQGRYMCPGLIDGHIHTESTFSSPSEFCNVVATHGTSAVICEPHEIANVLGPIGLGLFYKVNCESPCQGLFYDALMCSFYFHGNIWIYNTIHRHN
jgi:adenine deaminase